MILTGYLKLEIAFAFSLFVLAGVPQLSLAQYNPQKLPPSTHKQNVAKTDKLSQKVGINGLPEYSGKQKFLSGMMHTTSIGPQYQEQFLAVEPSNQVLDWYKNALSGYKWDIIDSDAQRVHAKKSDGSSVVVTVSPAKSPDGRSMVRINYHDYHVKRKGE